MKRNFSREKNKIIKSQVTTLKETRIVKEIEYPKWLSNVVLVKKACGLALMYIDFTTSNYACPKDCFPYPILINLSML